MKTKLPLFIITLCMMNFTTSQNKELPYYEIPEASETYTAGTVAARMVDGLGFRYYWATEGLRDEDLAFKPSEEGRTTGETNDHIYGLTKFILGAVKIEINVTKEQEEKMTFAEKRKQTLLNIKMIAELLRKTEDLSQFDNDRFKFWNMLNGPIADALWHCGQVISHRRTSGNPYNSKASVFSGKVRD